MSKNAALLKIDFTPDAAQRFERDIEIIRCMCD